MGNIRLSQMVEEGFSCLVRKKSSSNSIVVSIFREEEVLVTCHLTLTEDFKIFRCRIASNNIQSHMQPKDLMAELKKSRDVIFGADEVTEANIDLMEGLFPQARGKWKKFCPLCLREQRVRFLENPVKYGELDICRGCAREQLAKQAEVKGFNVSKTILKYLDRVLDRTNDYDQAFKVLSASYEPSSEPELTLYDCIHRSDEEHPQIKIEDLLPKIPGKRNGQRLVKRLKELGIRSLLPVQSLAVKNGLFEKRDLLIISQTSSGKTLISEMSGVLAALEGKKFLYLTPLVALANLRYEEFQHKYGPLGLRSAIRVGAGRINTGKDPTVNTDIKGADIIVATYEGLEQMLRSGKGRRFYETGVIAVDEIQNLEDRDRGHRLDGLIKKIRVLCPPAQLLYLSATVGNPEFLASKLGAKLVFHRERLVPLKRHVMPITLPGQKTRLIRSLIKSEFSSKSNAGYRGQTMVFTNSRRKCHKLASSLSSQGISMEAYHSGLSYGRKRRIESDFREQNIAGVVTTAALAAGVDLPASQVIFDTLAMGREWISVGEFHQMTGRAGRLGFHDSGKAVLMVEPGKSIDRSDRRTEEEVAMELLENQIEDVRPKYTQEDLTEQVLADISTFGILSAQELDQLQNYSVGFSSSLKPLIHTLLENGMVSRKNKDYLITSTGRAASSSFLNCEQARCIINEVNKGAPPEDIIVSIDYFDRAYLSERLQNQIRSSFNRKTNSLLFNSDALELLSHPRRVASNWLKEIINNLSKDLLDCSCNSSPYCGCPERKFSKKLIEMRLSGLSPLAISKCLFQRYGVKAYPGDVLEYLNNTVRLGEAVAKFADILANSKAVKQSEKLCLQVIGAS